MTFGKRLVKALHVLSGTKRKYRARKAKPANATAAIATPKRKPGRPRKTPIPLTAETPKADPIVGG